MCKSWFVVSESDPFSSEHFGRETVLAVESHLLFENHSVARPDLAYGSTSLPKVLLLGILRDQQIKETPQCCLLFLECEDECVVLSLLPDIFLVTFSLHKM